MNVLKIATAGSVDDGKSTLIGRLLYDTRSLTKDKLEAIQQKSKQLGFDYLDFSLVTDGLVAEREQGITIDVAHIYFSTKKRSYIIADTPGHVEYTRNMVTGASTSQASIILIDARKGVVEQTYRHFFINNLLRIKHIVVAINKMDLVNYSEEVFNNIKQDFTELMAKRDYMEQEIRFIPVSALKGENVVFKSKKMDWYKGETIINHFENLNDSANEFNEFSRFPVQYVIRPKIEAFHDYRGYAGKVYGGSFKVDDHVTILPSMKTSTIKTINFFDKSLEEAESQSSVSITINDDINISRGDMIVKTEQIPKMSKSIEAIISWFDTDELKVGNSYVVQHGVHKVLGKVSQIFHKIEPDYSGLDTSAIKIEMNDIAKIELRLNKPIYIDSFKDNRSNGSFILIDKQSNNTVATGFIQ